ncbi:MAG: LPS assembly protein LptD [Chlamydiales bacterium]
MIRYSFFLIFLLSAFASLMADELTTDPPTIWKAICVPCRPTESLRIHEIESNIVVDLLDPVYENGMITTDRGGILTAPGLRVQAQKITHIRSLDTDPSVFNIFCEGNLLIDYYDWVLVGESFYYDFLTHTGYLTNGRVAAPPWYGGGKQILLLENGDIVVLDGYLSTSEGECKDVLIQSPRLTLSPDRVLVASNTKAKIKRLPIFWLPSFKLDLKNLGRSPFGVRFGWGGFMGSHLSLVYRFLSWGALQGTARIDGFFGQGVGGGVETIYNPKNAPTQFYTRNYYANDIAIDDPRRRNRYRFQGTYYDCILGTTIDGIYDFVSDGQMAADYQIRDFDLNTAGRTQVALRHQKPSWIANLFVRPRVNNFQSVNQELPSFQLNWHPHEIPGTGIVFENCFKASYLNFVFSDDIVINPTNVNAGRPNDFNAGRLSIEPYLYRPFRFPYFTLTPQAGFIGIAYSQTNHGEWAGQAVGDFSVNLETSLSKCTPTWKHVIEPYIHPHYLTHPTLGVDDPYIFTINDAYNQLILVRFGSRHSFFTKTLPFVKRFLWMDVWANAFFDIRTFGRTIPKGYLNLEWQPFSRMLGSVFGGWNFEEKQLDFYNIRLDWTWNEHFAFSIEYRHRGRFDWRKADFYNFILESARTIPELLDSPLSDRRETLLFTTFIRPTPDWTAKFDLRYGWNRFKQQARGKKYLEYLVELTTLIFEHWRFTAIYEKKEADNRYSVSLKLDPGPPPKRKACGYI